MKIVGVVVGTLILLLLIAWWLGMSFSSVNQAIIISQGSGDQGDMVNSGKGPIEYSRQKIQEINEVIVGRGEEVEKTTP